MNRPTPYGLATAEARAAYDTAETRQNAAWAIWDQAARALSPGDPMPPEWETYLATLGPLQQATAALFAAVPAPAAAETQLALFGEEAKHAAA